MACGLMPQAGAEFADRGGGVDLIAGRNGLAVLVGRLGRETSTLRFFKHQGLLAAQAVSCVVMKLRICAVVIDAVLKKT